MINLMHAVWNCGDYARKWVTAFVVARSLNKAKKDVQNSPHNFSFIMSFQERNKADGSFQVSCYELECTFRHLFLLGPFAVMKPM